MPKNRLKSTVVIATYNGEKFIYDQLDSIRNQTRTPDQVIICDDGSTDCTVELVANYIYEFNLSNWKLLKNPINKGYARNFIDMMSMARNDVIFLCDQDDIWKLN